VTSEALADLVAIDISGTVATGYCGHLMAALGARVIDVEAPGAGHPTRRLPPFASANASGGAGASSFHSWIAARKESVECDLRTPAGRARLLELAASADVLLEAFRPGELAAMGLDRAALEAANRSLIVISMPWFGPGGPLAGFQGGDPLVSSLVGAARSFGPVEGPPMLPSGHGSQIVAGASAFIAALGHLIGRARGRIRGAHVDANVLEANLSLTDAGTIGVYNACAVPPRLGLNRYWPTYPAGIYRAQDGWIGITAVLWTQWRSLCEMLELPDLIAEPRYRITIERMADAEPLDRRLAPGFELRTVEDWFHSGQAQRVPFAMVPTAAELLECEQFKGRAAFARYELEGHGAFRAPAVPFRLAATPAKAGGAAPRLGQHASGAALRAEPAGVGPNGGAATAATSSGAASGRAVLAAVRGAMSELAQGSRSGAGESSAPLSTQPAGPAVAVAPSASHSSQPPAPALAVAPSASRSRRPPALAATSPRRRPDLLDGIRVVDLTMGWAGPLAARHLGDLGAEVIKIESCRHFDWWRGWDTTPEGRALHIHEKSSAFNMVNRNKLGITLDLTSSRGVELVKRLVAVSDVVVENYAATVLPKLGLGWDALHAVNESLIMLSMPPFGATGPWRGYRAYGSTVEQASGLPHLQGEEGGPPLMQHVALGDPIAGIYGAAALLVALWHRERTGEGQQVDLSHVEALFAMGVSGFLEQETGGRAAPRLGRRHREHAPHGVYPCAGVEEWITITVTDDAQWNKLAELMGLAVPPLLWPREERFATAAGRKAHEEELDRGLAEWTALRDRDLLANKLQNLGIPAAPVYDVSEPLQSPQLVARGFWQWMEREWVGRQPNPSMPYRPAGGGPYGIDFPSPTLGQHNEAVLGGILGLSAAEIEQLREQGIIGNEPTL
jgi:crotonobetainyl-CoA:carnitine CoA-transferase CaiB-like acyl-CoA transferase